MIVSHKHKFIFVKTVKTAGTGIECWLNSGLGKEDVATPIVPAVEGHIARNHRGLVKTEGGVRDILSDFNCLKRFLKFQKYRNHMGALEIRKNVGEEVWGSYFKFCVERNPWDKVVSLYFMIRKRDQPELKFEDFLRLPVMNAVKNFERYTDKEGELIVDQVVRFENLSAELDALGPRLGARVPFSEQGKVKADYGRDGLSYRGMFTSDSRGFVGKSFSDEIECWKYLF